MTLDTLVKDAESVPLTDEDIIAIAMGMTKVVRYSELPQYDSIFDLLQPYNNVVLFYETASRNDGHWVCVLYHEDTKTIEFFDSYGLDDRKILSLSQTSQLYVNGIPYLTYLLEKAKRESHVNVVFNTKILQSKRWQVATCGRYAAMRSRLKHVKLYQFIDLFKGNEYPADYLVSALTVMFSPTASSLV